MQRGRGEDCVMINGVAGKIDNYFVTVDYWVVEVGQILLQLCHRPQLTKIYFLFHQACLGSKRNSVDCETYERSSLWGVKLNKDFKDMPLHLAHFPITNSGFNFICTQWASGKWSNHTAIFWEAWFSEVDWTSIFNAHACTSLEKFAGIKYCNCVI